MQQVMVPLRLSVQTKTNKADNFFKKEAHIREDPRSQVSILTMKEAMSDTNILRLAYRHESIFYNHSG